MSALMPQAIGIFTALFKREEYILDLFDCTYYQDIDSINLGKNTTDEKIKKFARLVLLNLKKRSKAKNWHKGRFCKKGSRI